MLLGVGSVSSFDIGSGTVHSSFSFLVSLRWSFYEAAIIPAVIVLLRLGRRVLSFRVGDVVSGGIRIASVSVVIRPSTLNPLGWCVTVRSARRNLKK